MKAPNGKELEPGDHVALFFAIMVVNAVGEDDAIPFYMYYGRVESIIMVS